jgi:phosphoribosylformylglycinamidine (FGAM) synthase-like enzyme
LAVTLAECGFAKGIGAQVTLDSGGLVPEFVLFGEDASRILISCNQKYVERIKQVAVQYALSAENIGSTVPDNLEISVDGKPAASAPVSELKTVWAKALEDALHTETEDQLAISN